jgi:renalase
MKPVAVIGAGIAGLTAARVLHDSGIPVVVFEKSAGLGGRMATRRRESAAFDHGAQYFKASTREFRATIAAWVRTGGAAAWFDDGFVGVPEMTAPARALGEGLGVVCTQTVSRLERKNGAWFLSALEGASAQPVGGFGAVLLALPAPQAASLLGTSGVDLPGVERATYNPCWALMVGVDKPIRGIATKAQPASDIIAWIADNSSKPQRPTLRACYVAHASAPWSRAHLELSREAARDLLMVEFAALTGADPTRCSAVAHRWRYALVERALGQPFLFDANLALGACGDWCLGARVEDAWTSGRAAGDYLAKATLEAT